MVKESPVTKALYRAASVADVVVMLTMATLMIPMADIPSICLWCIVGGWLALRVGIVVERRVRVKRARASS
jgi:hypothetical protein